MKLILLFLISLFINLSLLSEVAYFTTASPSLILREEPSRNSTKIINIPKSEKVKLIEESSIEEEINGKKGKWVKIEWKSQTGWVFNAYIEARIDYKKATLKDLINFKTSNKESIYFTGYYYEGNQNIPFAYFQLNSSEDIYVSYEAGGGSATLLNKNYKNDSLTLAVKFIETINNHDENQKPKVVRDEKYVCTLLKSKFILFLEDQEHIAINCEKN